MIDSKKISKITIVYVIDGLGMGGAERLMVPILRYLDRGLFEPRVCVLQNKDGNPMEKDLMALGVPVDYLSIPYLRDLTAIYRLNAYLKNVSASLVHTQLEFANIFGNIVANFSKLPSVSTIHTMPSQNISHKMQAHQVLEMTALRYFCKRIISVSEEARLHHLKISYSHPEQVKTIYNGIDLSGYIDINREECAISVRAEFSLPVNAKLITTVAVLREPKGIQYMLEASPEVFSKNSNVYYLIVGDGIYRDKLEQTVDTLGIKDRVIFTGKRNDIPRLLSASDIFVLPTLTEALPTVLAEAMAARLPIIASHVGGIPEMIGVENGILLQPKDVQALSDACSLLLSDTKKCNQMGEAGWKIVNQKFNIITQVESLKKLYLELVENEK